MLRYQLLRKPLSNLISSTSHPPHLRHPQYQTRFRLRSTISTTSRANRILDRVPHRLRRYTDGLRTAPFSHVVSFLILHELTAIVPLVGLAGAFHYWGLPSVVFSADYSAYLTPGIERFGRYFRRKGWFGLSNSTDDGVPGVEESTTTPNTLSAGAEQISEGVVEQGQTQAQSWNLDTPGAKIVVEVAAAYAITKALLPLRLMLSVWATPWFARAVVGRIWKGTLGLQKGTVASGTSATAATAGKTAKEVGKGIT